MQISKNNLLKSKFYQNPPIIGLDSLDNKSEIMTFAKEKINKLTNMVDEYLKYKQSKKKAINVEKFQKSYFDKEILNKVMISNQTLLKKSLKKKNIKKESKILEIDDNYFENDENLYSSYGGVPHFISFN